MPSDTARMKRLGVLGTLVWDRIYHPSAEHPREQWGGIFYSLAAMTAACPPGWEVVPIVKVGSDLAEPALALLSSLPSLRDLGAVRVVPEPNNCVELRYLDPDRRTERLTGGVPSWSAEEILDAAPHLDALYINFISGQEVDLAGAQRLRRACSAPIYADLHSLFLGPASDLPRAPRALPRWREWLACFDAVQLNRDELALLAAGEQDPWRLASAVPSFGPRLLLVTMGPEGAAYVAHPAALTEPERWRDVAGPTDAVMSPVRVPVAQGPVAGDPTGCGDVWGSTVFAGLLRGLNVETAVRWGHRAATEKLCHPDTRLLPARLSRLLATGPGTISP